MSKTLSNGVVIPRLGFGSGTALYNKDADGPTALAIKAGFTHLDGAQVYNNEESMGKAIAAVPRESLFVTTKLGPLKEGETVRSSFQGSLKRLGLSYVDLWLVHTPVQHVGRLKEVWKACEELYHEGLAKSIGVSNFQVKHLEEILEGATVVPHVNQIEYHPYVHKVAKPILDFNNKHGIATQSFGGLAPIARGPRTLDPVLQKVRAAVEKRHGGPVTDGQVLMKWLEAKDIIIITTSFKESRLKEYLDTLKIPALTAEEEREIDEEGSKTHYRRYASHMDS